MCKYNDDSHQENYLTHDAYKPLDEVYDDAQLASGGGFTSGMIASAMQNTPLVNACNQFARRVMTRLGIQIPPVSTVAVPYPLANNMYDALIGGIDLNWMQVGMGHNAISTAIDQVNSGRPTIAIRRGNPGHVAVVWPQNRIDTSSARDITEVRRLLRQGCMLAQGSLNPNLTRRSISLGDAWIESQIDTVRFFSFIGRPFTFY